MKKVIVVEELDPFLETEIKALGYKVFHGKDLIPNMYELSPEIVEKALTGKKYKAPAVRVKPGRACPAGRRTCAPAAPTGRFSTRSRSSGISSSAT